MCVRASMKAAKPLHIVLATNPNPTRTRGYPLNINPKPDPKPDSISGPAGSGRVADLYDEDDEHADELPWDGFWQFVQTFFGYANRLLQQLSGWLDSEYFGGEDAGCGGPGMVWLHMVCGCEAGWMYC